MDHADVIVIGAGMGGLAAAGVLAERGLSVLVFEKEDRAGGYVAGFRRQGFYFDATGAFVAGCDPGGEFHRILSQIGVAKHLRFASIRDVWNIFPEFDLRVDYTSPAAYIESIKARFDRCGKALDRYARQTLRVGREFQAFEAAAVWKKALLPFFFPRLMRYARASHAAILADHFGRDLRLWQAVSALPTALPPSRLSYAFVAVLWTKVLNGGVFYPLGGMAELSRQMAGAIRHRGGRIECGCRVLRILTDAGRAVGVELDDGRRYGCDWLIGDINPFQAQGMLPAKTPLYGRRHSPEKFRPSTSAVLYYVGLKAGSLPAGWPYFVSIHTRSDSEAIYRGLAAGSLDAGMHIVMTVPSLLDARLAPAGCHSLKILVHAPGAHQFVRRYAGDRARAQLQRKVFEAVQRLSGLDLSDRCLFVEQATPLTLQRRTGNQDGAMYGFDADVDQVGPLRPPNRTALDNLLWVGHYTRPAHGIVGSAMAGRFAADIIRSQTATTR